MEKSELERILLELSEGKASVEQTIEALKDFPFSSIGEEIKVDTHRSIRKGFPEVVFGQGKTPEQILKITSKIFSNNPCVLITRTDVDAYNAVRDTHPEAVFNKVARTITLKKKQPEKPLGVVAIATGGTTDISVAEEAAETALIMGCDVVKIYDAGVAGIHRLLMNRDMLKNAGVVIAVAGMEGALPSVVGGLVDVPVIAVPTSVGYGASFGGLAALLAMLNSCSSGVVTVNIDNGFGAGYAAAQILRSGK